jgi:hypothetical protein
MSTDEDDDKRRRLFAMVASGAKILGGGLSGAVAFQAGDVAGAAILGAVGTLVGDSFEKIGGEIAGRVLGRREQVRIGGAIALAHHRIRERLEKGDKLRDDDIFEESYGDRSAADEILETFLTKVKQETEERKIPFQANLYANMLFEKEISPNYALHLIRCAENMSFRQLILLRMVPEAQGMFPDGNWASHSYLKPAVHEILIEIFDLLQRSIIYGNGFEFSEARHIRPHFLRTHQVGTDLIRLMGLQSIDRAYMRQIVETLKPYSGQTLIQK